jgi:hypothetical protein
MLGNSSAGVLAYLDKENEERNSIFFDTKNEDLEFELNQEYLQNQNKFFSNSEDKFYTNSEATNEIDGNISERYKQKESAFFMMNVSPSKQELEHLKGLVSEKMKEEGMDEKFVNNAEKTETGRANLDKIRKDLMHQLLRDYSREVMKEYAENFGREVYTHPENLPNQKEERQISKEIKNELEERGISKFNPEYIEKFDLEKREELERLSKKEEDLTKTEANTLSSNLKKSLESRGIPKLNPEYQKEFSRLKIEKAQEIGKDFSTRPLTEKDLVWFAKVEEKRTYKATDRWVQENKKFQKEIKKLESKDKISLEGKAKIEKLKASLNRDKATGEIVQEGMKKGGDQYHIHIVVSRYDKNPNKRHKVSLSPLSHKKQGNQANNLRKEGFDRNNFFAKIENKFDQKYNFQREYSKTYENFRNRNNTTKLEKIGNRQVKSMLKKPVNMIKNEVMKVSGIQEISKINPLKYIPLKIPATPMQAVMLGVKLAKKVIDLGR